MKRILQKILLFVAWSLAGLVVLVGISVLLIQTQPVKNKLSRIVEKQAEKVLNGELTIGEIGGNFFTNLKLEDVLWTYEKDTFAYFNSVDATYNLWGLTHGELQIKSASINAPYVYLQQRNDSTWNIESLIKEQTKNQTDTTSSSGKFHLLLSDFELNEGRLQIQALDSIIPDEVKKINLKANGSYSAKEQDLTVSSFSFQTQRPDITLLELNFDALRNDEIISLNNLHLKTAQNALNAEANYSNESITDISAELKTEPVYFNEFEFLLPTLNLPARPVIDLKTNSTKSGVEATLSVNDQNQQIHLDIFSENLLQFISDGGKTDLKYKISGNVEKINLAHWLGNKKLDHIINGDFEIDGTGINPKTADINLDGDFWDCVFSKKPVEEINMTLRLNRGDLTGEINADGNFGAVSVMPEIKDLLEHPTYNLQAQTRGLNLAPLFSNDSLRSHINLTAEVSGEDFNPENMEARANLIVSQSSFSDYTLDSLVGQVNYSHQNIVVDSLWAKANSLKLKAGGNYSFTGSSDIQMSANFDSAQVFSAYIPLDSIFGSGKVNAHLLGKHDSLSFTASVNLQKAGFAKISAGNLAVDVKGQMAPEDTTFIANARVANFKAGDFELDSIVASANYFIDSLQIVAQAHGNDFHTQLKSEIALDEIVNIALSEWKLNFKNQNLELTDAPALIEIDSLEYRLSNFKMTSDNSDSAQYIKAGGVISQYAEEDFMIEIANINIVGLLESLGVEADISGRIDASATLGGTARSPEMNGNLTIEEALAYGYQFSEFGGEFNLKDDRLNFDAQIVPPDTGLLEINANIPLEARFDSMSFILDKNDNVSGELSVQHFPISAMQFLARAEKVDGFLNGQVDVGGTLNSPKPEGELKLNNAEVIIPEYGIEYTDIVLDLHFSEDAAQLDSFYVKSDDGDLKASGTVDFGSAIYNGNIRRSEIAIHFNDFNPVDHRQFNMELSGDVSLKGEAGGVVFDGDLEIPEADIYLPAVMNMTGRFTEPDLPEPVLMRELEKLNDTTSSSVTITDTISTNDTLDLSYLSDLTGRLSINFPQNTWIKNDNMFVEISGELELIKNAEFFELFGSVDIERGQYTILGKTFKVDRGTITFQGGEELMPRLNIEAVHTFRNPEQAERELTVQVLGTANQPEINFTMDGSRISEGDALSYILFGVEMNELTIQQQEDVSGAGQIAGSAAMSLLSAQLTDLLGENLDVDYIELKGDGNFENATVIVGKYITNDLFVSYEQRFGETDEKDISKYEVKLEYELFKFLFLQLNNSSTESGFDVIIKLDSD
ncbi:translocation/assembly module TamB domain-containing protein [Draconibacterium halophilum]|uniref:Translocation and assembly module TamB C-terminal domain-containing protein n=1 Tax=Draconibacterium halophilum TaxID=2706887 RepID=A0A6C0RFX2_9BACT|nr:translocation/assembly module TamB domain-containing protein [Draconibacterium halophilum]QIA09310.1 hypothetical protein G0Q07_17050 [Draconibacterium halophilum]